MRIILICAYTLVCNTDTISTTVNESKLFIVVIPRNGSSDGWRVFADGRFVNGGGGCAVYRLSWFVLHAQPTHEYDEQLEQHEGNQQRGESVRVPVKHVLLMVVVCVLMVVEVHLPAEVTLMSFKFEFVLDPDLLEHYLVFGSVANAPFASPSIQKKRH